MGLLIGMDEAGYGPNLGPLVVTVTAWEVPAKSPRTVNLWNLFDGIVSRETAAEDRIVLGDSKSLYSPAIGLGRLEAGVLSALALAGHRPETFSALLEILGAPPLDEPWFHDEDLSLPVTGTARMDLIDSWTNRCRERGVRLRAVRSDVVQTRRFNSQTRRHDSKGRVLSEISLSLVQSVWPAEEGLPILVQADKHGGRNRYHEFLSIVVGDQFICGLEEGLERSRYRAGTAEFRFEVRSERYLPVALASMVSKYVRELSMILFNRFWRNHLPELRSTAGYPTDAGRFKQDIAAVQSRLGISDEVLWRER